MPLVLTKPIKLGEDKAIHFNIFSHGVSSPCEVSIQFNTSPDCHEFAWLDAMRSFDSKDANKPYFDADDYRFLISDYKTINQIAVLNHNAIWARFVYEKPMSGEIIIFEKVIQCQNTFYSALRGRLKSLRMRWVINLQHTWLTKFTAPKQRHRRISRQ